MLKSKTYRHAGKTSRLVDIIDNVKYTVFGIISPTDDKEDEQPEIIGMPAEQEGQGVKILTPQQMLTRLPISLPQLKTGNNSQKLKNKIRQRLYSLYR